MFSNAQDFLVTGGSFSITNNVNTRDEPSLGALFKRVAPNAILNAGGRADEVKCHPGTREEVIGRIERWGDAQDSLTTPMFWLSGPAGAGKSAIMQTIAERCEERGAPHANFFFFRADASRNDASPLIATLLHQIILLYPSLRDPVATLLAANPLIFNSTVENQLAQLIITPLYSIQQLSSAHPLLLLIDGLDECDSGSKRNQQQILRAFDKLLAQRPQDCPLRLLVASRDESQIRAAFNGISSRCIHLYLDDQYSPESDIRVFVEAQFKQVRRTHPLSYLLGAAWPSVKDVSYIVSKSSGQFIYAATVMRFIRDSSASPKLSLERVKGAARLATKSPFSHLDAIYTYILAQVDDQEAVRDVLHAQLLIGKLPSFNDEFSLYTPSKLLRVPFMEVLGLFNERYTEELILSCLADLTPIARYSLSSRKLLFHHASFPDYLVDQSRSGDYLVDVPAFNYKLLPIVLEFIRNGDYDNTFWLQLSILGIRGLEKLPPGFMNTLASSRNVWSQDVLQSNGLIFRAIHTLCITADDIVNFKRIIRQWICGVDHITFMYVEGVPFSRRYFQMARADRHVDQVDDEMLAALCPETDFDRHETALWLNNLLHHIHKNIYPRNTVEYNRLLYTWILWAKDNNIPCEGLEDLPYAWMYIMEA